MKRLLTWALKAGFSILDQGFVSIGNFGLSVLLARLLRPAEYGAFSVAFATFLSASAIHNSLLIEPMSVLGPARHQTELLRYTARVLWLHLLVTVPLAILGIAISFFFFRTALGPALLVMSLCLPFLLLFWTTRRAHYLESHADLAATSSFVYGVCLAAFIGIAWKSGHLTVSVSFMSMAAASVIAAGLSMFRLDFDLRFGLTAKRELSATWREHWSFGKWLLPSALLFPLLFQVQTFATGALLGLPAAGQLRVLQNPVMPAIQVVTALALLAIPALARCFGEGRIQETYRRGLIYTAAMTAIAGCYELGLVITGNAWDVLLYKGVYAEWDYLMPILGLVPVASALAGGCAVILRAVQRPGLITAANLAGGVFGVISVYPLIQKWHVQGAVYGLLGSQVVTAVASVALVIFSRVHSRKFAPTKASLDAHPFADRAVTENS